jgi:hypothetical protein
LTLGWTKRDGRSVQVETLTGEQLWASVRVRTAEQSPSIAQSGGLPVSRQSPETDAEQRSLVLLDRDGAAITRVPLDAVTGRTRLLTLPAAGERGALCFGPVDVAVLRRLVSEAARRPVEKR